ncbi:MULTISPECIES: AAA family ATPase [Thiorhodovibrio]|uniref:AAA family ATPase n=1 Tax=Thiorhodovibrio TaxID=61593 RepID=UPI0019128396|nr:MULTISPECIES: AAA family ATPase [Thiorhodovibrio]MBK5968348.1 AAA family ATPase [Thiorhodovibrio winogradskyi]WPL13203.1 putative AAA-ATPase [Thiorhodovibrio litoralis]
MRFPYGLSNFATLRYEGYWYQDRTDRIPALEAAGRQLVFLRPRRFGKSLLLSLLEHYYDLNRADQFDALFGSLAIGQNPTQLHNQYFVLRWDFSLVAAHGELGDIEASLHRHLNGRLAQFAADYQAHWTRTIEIHPEDALASLQSVLGAVRATPHKLYLLIDEYDNFANEILTAGRPDSQARYETLLQGEGLMKTVFKHIKAAAGGQGLDRVFIVGVSPVVLSDMTSGYNVGEDLFLLPQFNDLCGFNEQEVAAVLHQLAAEGGDWSAEQALATMRTFYNGYRFTEEAGDSLYNPTLSLYFFKALATQGKYPRQLLDENMAMDRNKLAYIAALPHGEDLLIEALSGDDRVLVPELVQRFGVADVLAAVKDQPFMASLLYFFGILTLAGLNSFNECQLRIPNLVARGLYVERLRERWLPPNARASELPSAVRALGQQADPTALCDLIEHQYFAVLSNRDYRWSNELLVKFAFLTLLFDNRLYMAVSELETGRGYVDLALIVRPDMRRFQARDLLLEFKYLSLKALGLSGAQVRAQPREALMQYPAVADKLDEAEAQARDYGGTLITRHGLADLRAFAVVALGVERLVWRVLDDAAMGKKPTSGEHHGTADTR